MAQPSALTVGILQADEVEAERRAEFGRYPAMFERLLGGVDPALRFETFNAREGDLPRQPDACDAYMVTGSRHSAFDDAPWIGRLAAFLRDLRRAKVRAAGVCFGHQLIAHALGGVVRRAAAGWGVGVHGWRWCASGEEFRLLAFHQDQVCALPPGARRLAGSAFCPNAAFVVDDRMLGLQGHPEFSKRYAERLLRSRRERIGDAFAPAIRSLARRTDERVVAQWIVDFLRGGKFAPRFPALSTLPALLSDGSM